MNFIKRLKGQLFVMVSKPVRGRTYSPSNIGKYFIWGFVDEELYGSSIKHKWSDYRCVIDDFTRGDKVIYTHKDNQQDINLENCHAGIVLDLIPQDDKVLVRFSNDDMMGHIANERYLYPGDLKLRI
jgi:hypothetical protein